VDFGSSGLHIHFCDTDDVEYLPIGRGHGRQAMAAEGKIVFKTCVKQAIVPIAFLKRLVNQPLVPSHLYPSSKHLITGCFVSSFRVSAIILSFRSS